MISLRKCILRCVKSGNKIYLDHNKEVVIGRGPQTQIIDLNVSKKQVSLLADVQKCTVLMKCLGVNSIGVNNKKIKKDEQITLKHGDQLELLLGKHFYNLEFIPSPINIDDKIDSHSGMIAVKRSVTDVGDSVAFKKIKLSNSSSNYLPNSSNITTDIWENIENGKLLIFSKAGLKSSSKIASYDLDGTIILTKSGRVFPKDIDDWQLANSAVKSTLKKYYDNGYKIVIFTNQAGISRGKTSVPDFKQKIEKIVSALGIPVQVFVATSSDIYRKPAPGMWNILIKEKNSGITVDLNESFYVGDAAGRIKDWMPKKKKDFSSADRLFAHNLNLKFQTPEAHFLKQQEGKYVLPDFQPLALDSNSPVSDSKIIADSKEVVIMIGSPGAGKSYFVKTHLIPAGYVSVNRDTLGSWQKCVSRMEDDLNAGKSVVIDNTNPDKVSRKRFIEVAAKYKVPCRCFVMNSSVEHAIHNNKFRQLINEDHVKVDEITIHSYRKKLEPPSLEEGFTEIVTINFVPKFNDPKQEKLYRMYLV